MAGSTGSNFLPSRVRIWLDCGFNLGCVVPQQNPDESSGLASCAGYYGLLSLKDQISSW